MQVLCLYGPRYQYKPPWAYIRRGDLTENLYIFISIHGGAFFRNFTSILIERMIYLWGIEFCISLRPRAVYVIRARFACDEIINSLREKK